MLGQLVLVLSLVFIGSLGMGVFIASLLGNK